MFAIPATIRALIFDCDGTLADTMPLHLVCWQKAMRELGGDITPEEFWGWAGVPTQPIIEMLNKRHGYTIDPIAGGNLKEKYYLETVRQIEPIKEVVDVVEAYRGKLPMAVATGGQMFVVTKTLETIGLMDAFNAIVTADDVQHGKPAPDIFLEAARRLNTSPEHCIVFEDADNGVVAAKAAGMAYVDVRTYPIAAFVGR
jgi:HAD superfamily hydrolase (TIGR01509 family)